MKLLNYIFKEPNMILAAIWARIGKNVKDSTYIKWRYQFIFKRKFHDDNPVTYNEKLNWLKIHYYNPLYTELVDKAEVKKYVSERIGKDAVIPTYGVWDKFDDIDFSSLPDRFVIKSTNGGGGSGVYICKDKSKIDKACVKHLLEESMKTNFHIGREWVYYNLKPRIIAEQFLSSNKDTELKDYKFFCINGQVKFFKIDFGRFVEHHANYYTPEGRLLPFGEKSCPPDPTHKEIMPCNLNKMVEIAEKLSQGIPLLRVDLYNVDGRIYFGELTFFPAGGSDALKPEEWEYKIGEMISLPEPNR